MRNYHQGDRWLSGVVTAWTGVFQGEADYRHHQDQLRKRSVEVSKPETPESQDTKISLIQVWSLLHQLPAGTEVVAQLSPSSIR